MNSHSDEPSNSGEVERILHDAMLDLGWLFPQTIADVERVEGTFDSAEPGISNRLRDPYALFDQLCTKASLHMDDSASHPGPPSNVPQLAFGSLIQLLRRQKGLTVDRLAKKARIEISELINIEQDPGYEPRPRTVHQLADVLELPRKTLVKLSNLIQTQDDKLKVAAVRFAARSANLAELSKEERLALAEFVHFLVTYDKADR